jgi:hypothetical protein
VVVRAEVCEEASDHLCFGEYVISADVGQCDKVLTGMGLHGGCPAVAFVPEQRQIASGYRSKRQSRAT